jgi:hypothetical protein
VAQPNCATKKKDCATNFRWRNAVAPPKKKDFRWRNAVAPPKKTIAIELRHQKSQWRNQTAL